MNKKLCSSPHPVPLAELIHEGEKFHQTVHHQHHSSSACSRHRHPQGLCHTWTCSAAVFQTMLCVCCGSNETTGKNKDKNGQRSQPADICEAAQRGVWSLWRGLWHVLCALNAWFSWLLSVGKRNRQKQVMWKLQEVYILHLFFSFVVGDNHHNSLSCISYFLSQNFGLI